MSKLLLKCDNDYHKFYIYKDYFTYEHYSIFNQETPNKVFTIYYVDIVEINSFVENSVVTYEFKIKDGSTSNIAYYYRIDRDHQIKRCLDFIKNKRIEYLALEDDSKNIKKQNQLIQEDSALINDEILSGNSIWDSPGFSNK